MNKKLEQDKLRYDASKTFLITSVSLLVAIIIGYWSVPESFKMTISFLLIFINACVFYSAYLFFNALNKLAKWYK
jgi:ABC-type multidrug transport system fused ATPase/permease subunit